MPLEPAVANRLPTYQVSSAARLRILSVTHYYSGRGGGVELVAHHLAREFRTEGAEVRWAAVQGDKLPDDILCAPLRGSHLPERLLHIPYPILSPLSWRRLGETIRWADVVHLHDALQTTSQAAAILARQYRKPIVLTQHVGDIPYRSRWLATAVRVANHFLARRLFAQADETIFISDVVRRQMAGSHDYRTIYNGVDPQIFHPGPESRTEIRRRLELSEREKIILFVGRFVEKKGLHALRHAVGAVPSVQWVFIGRGPVDPRNWGASNLTVHDHKTSKDLADFYRAADLLVLPSVGEGLPLVVQEALSCGLPAIVSEEVQRACPEAASLLISAGANAVDFEPVLKATLKSCSFSPDERLALAQKAHSLWSWKACARSYLDLFGTLTDEL